MPFFSSKPSLSDGERARIEFPFQLLLEHFGSSRFVLPVIETKRVVLDGESLRSPIQVRDFVGQHLGLDVSSFEIQSQPSLPIKQSGGGS